MADLTQSTWKQPDANNNAPSPDGFPVGIYPNQVGGAIRAERGALKRFFDRINPMMTSTGAPTAYNITYEQGPPAYVRGETFRFWANATNTGPATLAINGLPPAPMVYNEDGAALAAGALHVGRVLEAIYDGTSFRMVGLDRYTTRIAANEAAAALLRTDLTSLASTTLSVGVTNVKQITKGTVTTGTVTFNYADGPVQGVEVAGNVTFALSGMLLVAAPLQINITYTSGTITMPTGVQWDLGGTAKATTFAGVGANFVAGNRYRVVFEMVNGVLTGVIA